MSVEGPSVDDLYDVIDEAVTSMDAARQVHALYAPVLAEAARALRQTAENLDREIQHARRLRAQHGEAAALNALDQAADQIADGCRFAVAALAEPKGQD